MGATALAIIALVVASLGLALSWVAFWRSGGKWDIQALRYQIRAGAESIRQAPRAIASDLAARIRSGYEETLEAMKRAEGRLDEIRKGASAELAHLIDGLSRRASDLGQQARDGLDRLRQGASMETQAAQEALARRARRLEANVQVLFARGEMLRAERLADKGEFANAASVLEDAVTRVRDARAKTALESGQVQAFDDVVSALREAIRQVRARAEGTRAQIERVMAASDSLLGSLEARDQLP